MIAMHHPDTGGTATAVNERQARLLESRGWVRDDAPLDGVSPDPVVPVAAPPAEPEAEQFDDQTDDDTPDVGAPEEF